MWVLSVRSIIFTHSYRYAGIGSRTAPPETLRLMARLAHRLEQHGYTLLSGGAPGADQAYESGVEDPRHAEIYVPWRGFQGRSPCFSHTEQPSDEAFQVAALLHPAWGALSPAARKLMARNSHQVLGATLRAPVDFVVCWTPDGCESAAERSRRTGGTGQVIALADRFGIPVLNLQRATALPRLAALVQAHTPAPPSCGDAPRSSP